MREVLDREDSPEEIAACLNCTKPPSACNMCGGPLRERAKPRKCPFRRKGYPKEIREQALALVAEGHTHREAAEAVGVSKAAVSRWAADEKRKENGT